MALEVLQTRMVRADPAAIWPDIADPERFAEWYAFCDAVEDPEPGVRVLFGSWGAQRSAVTTAITDCTPPSRYAWRHTGETLDGRPARSMAMETTVEIVLTPVEGGTTVEIVSRQQAAGWWQGVVIRLLGQRRVGNMLQQSLTLLAARHG
jgi:uncharacterized protein YndB with AHSA1/START domain